MAKRDPWNPLRKSYPKSVKINRVSIGAETLYTRLLAQSDDRHHYYADPQMVMAELYAIRWKAGQVSARKIQGWLRELGQVGLIAFYQSGGDHYLELVGCKKCLRPDRPRDIRFPGNGFQTTTKRQPNDNQTTAIDGDGDGDGEHTHAPSELEGFGGFWTAYPRKKAKGDAEKAWKQIGGAERTEAILAGLKTSKADWTNRAPDKIPYPATWLRARGWEDEPDSQADVEDVEDVEAKAARQKRQDDAREKKIRGMTGE